MKSKFILPEVFDPSELEFDEGETEPMQVIETPRSTTRIIRETRATISWEWTRTTRNRPPSARGGDETYRPSEQIQVRVLTKRQKGILFRYSTFFKAKDARENFPASLKDIEDAIRPEFIAMLVTNGKASCRYRGEGLTFVMIVMMR